MFPTDTLGAGDADERGLGRVLEDGDVTCHGTRNIRGKFVRDSGSVLEIYPY